MPTTGSSMQVSVCVSPSSGPDSCRTTAAPIALWPYGRRRDCHCPVSLIVRHSSPGITPLGEWRFEKPIASR
jgi:hypothetical protein